MEHMQLVSDGEAENKHPRSVKLSDLREAWPNEHEWKATRLAIDARHLGLEVAPLAMDPEVIRC